MPAGKTVPDWVIQEQKQLFRYILDPLNALFPTAGKRTLENLAHGLFSAVHGMVLLGLERRAIGVPLEHLREQIGVIVEAVVVGFEKVR
jgi:hypothetical protein